MIDSRLMRFSVLLNRKNKAILEVFFPANILSTKVGTENATTKLGMPHQMYTTKYSKNGNEMQL